MLSFKRTFQTQQQALDVYKSQLSTQHLFVESFESAPAGTSVTVTLIVRETDQTIQLPGQVERAMGRSEAISKKYGNTPGLWLSVPITPDLVAPLRAFFLAAPTAPKPPVAPATQTPAPSPATSKPRFPFSPLDATSEQDIRRAVDEFLLTAQQGSLHQIFGVPSNTDRQKLRQLYNAGVKNLHPDTHRDELPDALSQRLGDAYQILNEAYKILQHPTAAAIYLDISRQNGKTHGMSLFNYKKFLADYRLKNASNISLAEEFVQKAQAALKAGRQDDARLNIQLALKYDPYNETARGLA